jgi:hypothetical protein
MAGRDRTIQEALAEYEAQHEVVRRMSLPVEDKLPFIPRIIRDSGGYRWFRSPNVVCLEKYRRLKASGCF